MEENEDTAVYPDISAQLPGVPLEEHEQISKPSDFQNLAGDALYNAGIDADAALRRANLANNMPPGPAVTEANEDKLVYELTFDLPDAGLAPLIANPDVLLGEDRTDDVAVVIPNDTDTASGGRRYPSRARRSAIGNQPYDTYAPRTTFLQLGTVRVHRSVLEANRLARMMTEERLLATMTAVSEPFVDDITLGWIESCIRQRRRRSWE